MKNLERRKKLMKTRLGKIILAVLILLPVWANATVVDITVATDKPTYQLGEYVTISVTAYNPNPEPVTLTTGFYFASYIMDGIYNWVEHRPYAPAVVLYPTIQPYDHLTASLTHGFEDMERYPLGIGTHTVIGEVLAAELIGNNQSFPMEFEVIPEPSMIALFGFALPALRVFTRRKT